MATSTCLIKGRTTRREFTAPFQQCVEMLEKIDVCVTQSHDLDALDFVLFFQSYPYEFSQSELAHLRRANPLAPFFFVLGVCCEGMLRTAGPLDSPFYCYAHGWSNKEIEQIRLFLTDQPSVFSLPLTAESDEIATYRDGRQQTADGSREGGVAACVLPSAVCRLPSLILTHFGPFGNDSAMNQLIADELRQQGFEPEFCCRLPSAGCRLPIFADADGSPTKKILESIQRLRQQFADNDLTVYVDSPRIDENDGYIRAGTACSAGQKTGTVRVLPKYRS